jgi:hypothetical protein
LNYFWSNDLKWFLNKILRKKWNKLIYLTEEQIELQGSFPFMNVKSSIVIVVVDTSCLWSALYIFLLVPWHFRRQIILRTEKLFSIFEKLEKECLCCALNNDVCVSCYFSFPLCIFLFGIYLCCFIATFSLSVLFIGVWGSHIGCI